MQTNRFKVGISPTLQSFIPLTPPFHSPLILFFSSFIHHVIFLPRLFGFNVHYNEQSCDESELSTANVRTISMVIIALKIESGSFFCTVKSYLYVCLQLSGFQLESFITMTQQAIIKQKEPAPVLPRHAFPPDRHLLL